MDPRCRWPSLTAASLPVTFLEPPGPPAPLEVGGGWIWSTDVCCLWTVMLSRRTSSWIDDKTVITVASAFWFSDISRRMCSMSSRVLSSSRALLCTCCRRTSKIRKVRWIASSCGIDNSWICAAPPDTDGGLKLPPGPPDCVTDEVDRRGRMPVALMDMRRRRLQAGARADPAAIGVAESGSPNAVPL